MAHDSTLRRRFASVSRESVLNPSMLAIWDGMGIGVAVVDAEGICRYMNPIQQRIDGFDQVIGKHITNLYVPHDIKCIPTIECLQKGKPILRRVYTYKTTNNFMTRTVTDFFALFDSGVKDGVIAFTSWLGEDILGKLGIRKSEGRGCNKPQTLYSFNDLVGKDQALVAVIEAARAAAHSSSPIMIWGESGTGKEVFAQAIHAASNRAAFPFVPVNCAAIPETLLESILFGTTKGTYTDASDKPGLFEEANHGTILLDELNSMPLGLQAKLLRVLQEKRVRRLGSHEEIPVDVRIISILNQHPLEAVQSGVLRRDFFYRLAVVSLAVPPLRERREDIPLLVKSVVANTEGGNPVSISDEAMRMFMEYHWPGNVRELEHVIEGSLAMMNEERSIDLNSLPKHFLEFYQKDRNEPAAVPVAQLAEAASIIESEHKESYYDYSVIQRGTVVSLKECMNAYESSCINNVLRITGGNVAKAARMMHLTPAGLRYRIKMLKIDDSYY
ncbi:sigma 54-interacting transcriptional regulator [uncultured Desulfovibrio sp.]|uniref:sigma-54 interaction domain-containing protein n=1 Tax=uncultured Desulfovibrio sp. TaxID=167968 RepID=UPI0026053D18|nr:sigma 54-interacting transcriptional regulator [uncultured Desulfovibrio sp.]